MASVLWLVLLIVFLILESSTVSLVSIWFSVGSLAAFISSFCHAPFWLQVVLFAGVSALMLACLRPIVRKYFKPRLTRTNVDSLIGSEGYVLAEIDNLKAVGTVKLGAMEWTARSTSGEVIPKGALVKVDSVEGVKAFVTLVEKNENA